MARSSAAGAGAPGSGAGASGTALINRPGSVKRRERVAWPTPARRAMAAVEAPGPSRAAGMEAAGGGRRAAGGGEDAFTVASGVRCPPAIPFRLGSRHRRCLDLPHRGEKQGTPAGGFWNAPQIRELRSDCHAAPARARVARGTDRCSCSRYRDQLYLTRDILLEDSDPA